MLDFVTQVKLRIYEHIAETSFVPRVHQLAAQLKSTDAAIREALDQLASMRLVVLNQSSHEILMAPPFSAVPTAHRGIVGQRTYSANCAWDAFGVVAALGGSGVVETASGGSGPPIRVAINQGRTESVPCVFHYAVPAARWWEDVVFT